MRPGRPDLTTTLDETLGFRDYEFDGEATARLTMPVRESNLQPFGIVHGGAFAALAESVCSRATWDSVGPELGAFGQANDSTFLRPASEGAIEATATALHRGRTTWVWNVEMRDGTQKLCAVSRVIIAVRRLELAGG